MSNRPINIFADEALGTEMRGCASIAGFGMPVLGTTSPLPRPLAGSLRVNRARL